LLGTEEEKLQQSFDLLDENQKGFVERHDFRKIVNSFA
jgi:Ca2+-binding EF-hand superfamily protein